jgi:hypothetical protein
MGGTFTKEGLERLKEEWPDIQPDIVYDLIEDCLYLHEFKDWAIRTRRGDKIELDQLVPAGGGNKQISKRRFPVYCTCDEMWDGDGHQPGCSLFPGW